jgi:hypothetical protein
MKMLYALAVFSIASLVLATSAPVWADATSKVEIPAISGMVKLDGAHYLTVHDTKDTGNDDDDKEYRLGILDLSDAANPVEKRLVTDWSLLKKEFPNDVESVCKLPSSDTQFLIVESSYSKDDTKYGRIIRIELSVTGGKYSAKAVHVQHFPKSIPNITDRFDNVEGSVTFTAAAGTCLVLGKRGKNANDAVLIWGTYDPNGVDFLHAGATTFWTNFKTDKNVPEDKRYCSDLFLREKQLLASSSSDPNKPHGPFQSALFSVGILSEAGPGSVIVKVRDDAFVKFPVDKVEALAEAPDGKSWLVIGTDNEDSTNKILWVP